MEAASEGPFILSGPPLSPMPPYAAASKGPFISSLMRCTVPVPTPTSRATLIMPFPARKSRDALFNGLAYPRPTEPLP